MAKTLTSSNTPSGFASKPTSAAVRSIDQIRGMREGYLANVAARLEMEKITKLQDYVSPLFGRFGDLYKYYEAGTYTKLDGTLSKHAVLVIFPKFAQRDATWEYVSWSPHALIDLCTDSFKDIEYGSHERWFDQTSTKQKLVLAVRRTEGDPRDHGRKWESYDWSKHGYRRYYFADDEEGYMRYAAKHNVIDELIMLWGTQRSMVVTLYNNIQLSKVDRILIGREVLPIAEVKALEIEDKRLSKEWHETVDEQPGYVEGAPLMVDSIDITKLDHAIEVTFKTLDGMGSGTTTITVKPGQKGKYDLISKVIASNREIHIEK